MWNPTPSGHVEVILGPMFAGKTEELLRRVRRAGIAGRRVEVVSHVLDTRRGPGVVASHAGSRFASRSAASAAEVERGTDPSTDLLAIDEAQFFGPELVEVVERLADRGIHVVVSGLSVTFDGRPFEPMPALAALAESVMKLTAVCTVCGADAPFHTRVHEAAPGTAAEVAGAEHIGGEESYQARCRTHFPSASWR